MHVLLQFVPPTLKQATTHPRPCWRHPDTHRHVSCWVTVLFSWVLVYKVLLCSPRVYFPGLCKFWEVYSGVNGDLLQEDLMPYPHPDPLSLRQTTADLYLHRRCSNSLGSSFNKTRLPLKCSVETDNSFSFDLNPYGLAICHLQQEYS